MEKYNTGLELKSFGFNNMGATCYFNAMLQSMLSCTSFINILVKNKENPKYLENPVTKQLIELIESTRSESDVSKYAPRIWKEMVVFLCRKEKKSINQVLVGQQCAREGFHCLMNVLEEFSEIQNLFLHRYKTLVHCFACDKFVSDVDSLYSIFEVQPNLKTEQLEKFKQYDEDRAVNMNEFLMKQTSYVDKDFVCPECKDRDEKYNMHCLVMIPEILVVLSKKYTTGRKLDVMTDFPKNLVFKGKGGKNLNYAAVSQIEHGGGLNGGHYWAISRRDDGWYTLNDNNVSKGEFGPTKNTYITFYHLM